jgi:Transposase domain (DUF772)
VVVCTTDRAGVPAAARTGFVPARLLGDDSSSAIGPSVRCSVTSLKRSRLRRGRFLPRLSHKGDSVRHVQHIFGMPQNFIESRCEQGFLLPPDVREWLPADHFAWFLIDAVAQMDLSAFYGAYRADGHGRAAYEPAMMVTLVLHAFSNDVRSSRAIERHCRQDVAYRVITGALGIDVGRAVSGTAV